MPELPALSSSVFSLKLNKKHILCNGGQHYVPYRWLLISNKLCDSTLCTCGGVVGGRNRCIMLNMTLLILSALISSCDGDGESPSLNIV